MREIRTLRRDVEGAGNVVWSEHMAKSTRQSSTLPEGEVSGDRHLYPTTASTPSRALAPARVSAKRR